MQYKLHKFSWEAESRNVIRFQADGSQSCIPFDLANTDYQTYLKWLEESNTPLPADESTQQGEQP